MIFVNLLDYSKYFQDLSNMDINNIRKDGIPEKEK